METTTATATSRRHQRQQGHYLSLLLFLLLSVFLTTVVVNADDPCLTTINSVAMQEGMVVDTSIGRSYTLCPNTEYIVGNLDFNRKIVDGQEMIPLRSNLHLKCGDTGLRSENCVVKNGDILLDGTHYYGTGNGQQNNKLNNVTIEGITFWNAGRHVAWMTKPGTITFKDCLFQSNRWSISPILLDYYNPNYPNSELRVVFEGCSFDENRFKGTTAVATAGVDPGTSAQPALIVSNSHQNRLIVKYCTFNNNNYVYNNTKASTDSFLIESSGPVTMANNCFESNQVGVSPVVVYAGGTNTQESVFVNNYQVSSQGQVCPFVSRFTTPNEYQYFQPRCLSFDATTCQADNYNASPAPTPKPTTKAPSSSPSKTPQQPAPNNNNGNGNNDGNNGNGNNGNGNNGKNGIGVAASLPSLPSSSAPTTTDSSSSSPYAATRPPETSVEKPTTTGPGDVSSSSSSSCLATIVLLLPTMAAAAALFSLMY